MNVKLKTVLSAALLSTTKSGTTLADTSDQTNVANTSVGNTYEATTDKQWMVDVDTSSTRAYSGPEMASSCTCKGGELCSPKIVITTSPGSNVVTCADEDAIKEGTGKLGIPNNMTIAVDPFMSSYIELVFTVRGIPAQNKDHILFLVYSPQTSPSPQIPTPKSPNKLALDLNAMEILAIYNIPAQQMIAASPTRLGTASPAPRTAISFHVNLDTGILPTFIQDENRAYLQAALMTKANYDAGKYDTMFLSELDTLRFVANECPPDHASIGVDEEGIMTVTDFAGNTTKTVYTTTNEAGAVHVGK
ncbi:hypothetical protein QUF54_03470 [Candidatus Marithioploca araucensis]|uniref:Uncharacterized protein n=1 Tax=Candidatus Marithioploca araucensis TaxID=70273 RepID=A0ABT7VRU8_9GAMM|nr:hypothetical protein [Candidatus Marithioploca araucensis]